MAGRDTIAAFAEHLGLALSPLVNMLGDPEDLRDFLERLGWDFDTAPTAVGNLLSVVHDARDFASNTSSFDSTEVAALLEKVLAAYEVINAIESDVTLDAAFRQEFPGALIDYLVVEYLLGTFPFWGFLLQLIGLIEVTEQPSSGARPAYLRRQVHWNQFDDFVADPIAFLKSTYQWGTPSFGSDRLFAHLESVLHATGLRSGERWLGANTVAALNQGAVVPANVSPQAIALWFERLDDDPESFELGFALYPTPQTATDLPGLAVVPFASAAFEGFTNDEGLTTSVQLGVDLNGGVVASFRPNKAVEFLADTETGSPVHFQSALVVGVDFTAAEEPILLFGEPDASRFEVDRWSLRGGKSPTDAVFFEFQLSSASIVLQRDSAKDGFVNSLLPEGGATFPANFGVGFATDRGIYFVGGNKDGTRVETSIQVGPLKIVAVTFKSSLQNRAATFVVATDLAVALGPIAVTINELGLGTALAAPAGRNGNLGSIDVGIIFKAPTGAGISIESGPISGSGFLTFGADRYTGALQLRVNQIAMSAFGVIDTKLPGGQEGFSFVILISAEFQAIQLGLGFTLNGVGGLVGINRTVDVDALRDMVRSGKIDKFLFPAKPQQNAGEIISNLSTAFPPAANRHVFAPMAKIGWGTPTIIEGKLGLALEVPAPFRLSLLGNVRADLPKKPPGGKTALIKMKMDVLGVLDIAAKDLAIDARLHDSNVGGFPISGDMAMRLNWGAQPNFAMAVGGFNPGFAVPPNFPALERIKIEFGSGENPSISAQAYLAVTSNTAQVGARAELKASGSGIKLHCWIGFDALFIFTPFQFVTEIDAGVRVEYRGFGKGVHLHATLSGPGPWKIKGKVCVSLRFWDACLSFSKTFGKSRTYELPEIDPWAGNLDAPGLGPALSDARNWQAALPEGASRVVTTRPLPSGVQAIDPLGAATVRQTVVPLNQKIERFGAVPLKEARLFKLQDARIEGSEIGFDPATIVSVKEYFAPAQFEEMKDAERLSAPAFEEMDAGFTLRSLDHDEGSIVTKNVEYETSFIGVESAVTPDDTFTAGQLSGMIRRSRGARVDASGSGAERFVDLTKAPKVTFHPPRWVVAFKGTLEAAAGAEEGSWTSARNQLRGMFAGKQHAVVPNHEAHAGL